ncbi:MAG: IMP cyclohydrolase, partial [Lentisphaeria bacterium]|nr:IMP cyclohydrolase [Lentisphaeria bacterium]
MAKELSRSSYLEKNVGDFSSEIIIDGRRYEKVDDLRYGTNPHQPAAYSREVGKEGVIGGMKILKNGKSGLSQTNLEDISGA